MLYMYACLVQPKRAVLACEKNVTWHGTCAFSHRGDTVSMSAVDNTIEPARMSTTSLGSLTEGVHHLDNQKQPSTPKRVKPAPSLKLLHTFNRGRYLQCCMVYGPSVDDHEVKLENTDTHTAFSPETAALLHGLSDSPESLMLKAEVLRSVNQLKRGPF